MRNILILGGTRFFGKRLVQRLLANGDRLTVASHNFSKVSLPKEVDTLTLERENPSTLQACRKGGPYDLVYDQICYSPSAAADLCTALKGLVGKIVHTSTQSVYLTDDLQREADFDPLRYPSRLGLRSEFDYGEGKRLAEAVYFQQVDCPLVAVRFPVVLGADDYTGRLDFHIERIVKSLPIVAANPSSRTSLISADDAADFLFWIGSQSFAGPINACATGEISLSQMLERIENATGKRASVQLVGDESSRSPYSQSNPRYLDNSLASSLGYKFSRIDDWLSPLIESRYSELNP